MTGFFSYISLLAALVCAGLGGFVLSRRPKVRTNRSFAAGMGAIALGEFGAFMAGIDGPGFPRPAYGKIVLAGGIFLPVPWLLFGQSLVHVDSSRNRVVRRMGMIGACLASAGFFFVLVLDVSLAPLVSNRQAGAWLSIFLILSLTAVLAIFESALRKADHEQRWRIKFLLLGVGAILVTRIFAHSQHLLFPGGDESHFGLTSTAVVVGAALIAFSLVRHQLLDVNVFVSRYLVYNSFTVFAVGAYLLVVGLAAQAIRSLGGSFGEYIGLMFALLAVLLMLTILLSTEIRKKVKAYIDRHFYRNRYDYHREWLSLTERLSSKLDVREIYLPVRSLFSETLWVDNTRLWVCDDGESKFRMVRLPGDDARGEEPVTWNPRLIGVLKVRGYPVTLDDLEEALRPGDFEESRTEMAAQGVTVLVPLVTGDVLVGILGCARSRSGYAMDREDFELMNTVARQAANSFLVARLSQSLVRVKEMEAFHAFSAFVLHDMKNFVSMLSLVVQNAERNYDNPEFRKDAKRSISQTVEKMKRMMESLAVLLKKPELDRAPTDIGKLAREALSDIRGSLTSRIVEDLPELPPVSVDPAQIRKIITNLVLNAEEAAAKEAEIRVAAGLSNGKVMFSVSDNGCGMSPDYIRDHLFKPFATTKSHGFGIGLYQVKSIVEAHNGRIEVESTVGKGSTFTILLPG